MWLHEVPEYQVAGGVARYLVPLKAMDGPSVVDNIKSMSSTGTWNEQIEDVLRLWAFDAQKRGCVHEKQAERFRFLRFWAFVPLIAVCLIVPWVMSEQVRIAQLCYHTALSATVPVAGPCADATV